MTKAALSWKKIPEHHPSHLAYLPGANPISRAENLYAAENDPIKLGSKVPSATSHCALPAKWLADRAGGGKGLSSHEDPSQPTLPTTWAGPGPGMQTDSHRGRQHRVCSQHSVVVQADYHHLGGGFLPVCKQKTEPRFEKRSHLTKVLCGEMAERWVM